MNNRFFVEAFQCGLIGVRDLLLVHQGLQRLPAARDELSCLKLQC